MTTENRNIKKNKLTTCKSFHQQNFENKLTIFVIQNSVDVRLVLIKRKRYLLKQCIKKKYTRYFLKNNKKHCSNIYRNY